jgi:copper homeostasis protein (lipoprotein)
VRTISVAALVRLRRPYDARTVTAGPARLEGTEWTLVELDGVGIELGAGERAPYFVLDPEGSRFSGSGGCNRLMGVFDRSGDALRFRPVATTRMACAEEVMQGETAFLDALVATSRFEFDGTLLVLLAGDRIVARLAASAQS